MTVRMVEIENLLPFVMQAAPSCPEPAAIRQLREACREFCDRAHVWRDYDEFPVSTPDSEGVCTLPDVAIVRIERAWLDENPLEPQTIGWLDENCPGWDVYTEDSAPARYITQLTPGTVTVAPKVTGSLKVRLVLKPSRTAATVPSFLVDDYGPQLGAGAAGKVLLTPNAEFTNPQLGLSLSSTFAEWVASMNSKVAKGQQRGRLRTKASFF